MRKWLAIGCNIIVPGTGFIVLQREWLGVSIALVFAMLATVGLWSVFITPASVPDWLAASSLAGAAACWLLAQHVLRTPLRRFRDPAVLREVTRLREQAAERAAGGDYAGADELLNVALTLDDEDVETNLQLAELLTIVGRFGPARRAWLRVGRLDREGAYRRHVAEALRRLPTP